MRLLSTVKSAIVPSASAPRTIKAGAFRGITMEMDLRSNTQVFLGLFEREIQPWLTRFAKGIKTGVDIGANQGEYSIYFLRHTQAESILAFEPLLSVLPLMRENLGLNGVGDDKRLRVDTKFVGDVDSESMCTLDTATAGTRGPYLIKLDVDGGEASVLRGAKKLLASGAPCRWIIETHSRDLEEECLAILKGAKFPTKVITNAWWRSIIPELRPLDHNRWMVAANEPGLLD